MEIIVYIPDTGLVILGGVIYNIPEDYEFLCKGSELTEEMASELVDKSSFVEDRWYHLAKRGFKANVESKGFYWLDNPISNPNKIIQTSLSFKKFAKHSELFDRAEEKTFKNPLIFVKK